MQTRHSTHWCRFLRTETRRRLTRPSVRAKIGLALGSLVGLSGSDRVWTALVLPPVVVNVGLKASFSGLYKKKGAKSNGGPSLLKGFSNLGGSLEMKILGHGKDSMLECKDTNLKEK